ncbi:MAG: UspA protein [Blastococcus sp.]|jgi:nucleotide-binding universal stress UspA family protein|nr:UspA protein [Blastococcus sp.]
MPVLVGYIPSPEGEAALERGIEEARTRDTELVVLNVARGEALIESHRLYDDPAAELTQRLDASGVPYSLRREVSHGPAADHVLAVLDEVRPEMLVIGLRPRTATGKLLFGSTAQRLILDAPCDVLAVKASYDH